MQEINIFYQDIKVGVLSYESKNDLFSLRYSEYWKENGYALSPHLSLEKEDFEDTTIRNFISNLLPEGESLSELCRIYRIDKNDSFTLLEKIGKEAAGAFCFIKEEQVFNLINLTKVPYLAKNQIIDWVCVNLALANADAHGKNISFVCSDLGTKLAPFYDIMNISLISNQYSDSLAMAISDEFDILKIKAYDLKEFCVENDINIKLFHKKFSDILNKIIYLLKEPSKFDFDSDGTKISFFKKYKENTLFRIGKLLNANHYLLFPNVEDSKELNSFYNANKKEIKK